MRLQGVLRQAQRLSLARPRALRAVVGTPARAFASDRQAHAPSASAGAGEGAASQQEPPAFALSPQQKDALATQLADAFASHVRQQPTHLRLADVAGVPASPEEGMEVQRLVIAKLEERHPFVRRVGYKIGASSRIAQRRLGLKDPFMGPLFSNLFFRSGQTLPSNFPIDYSVRGIECEVLFTNQHKFRAREPYTEWSVAENVGMMLPVLEIVGSRFAPEERVPVPMLIADCGGFAGLVLGNAYGGLWSHVALPELKVMVRVNGREEVEGVGSMAMGNPITSLTHMVNELCAQGFETPPHIAFITGTMMGLLPVAPGDRVEADFGVLGKVALNFETPSGASV